MILHANKFPIAFPNGQYIGEAVIYVKKTAKLHHLLVHAKAHFDVHSTGATDGSSISNMEAILTMLGKDFALL